MSSAKKIVSYEEPSLERLERLILSDEIDKATKQSLKAYKDKIVNGLVKVDYEVDGFGRFKQKAVRSGVKTAIAESTYYSGTLMMRVVRALVFEEKYDDLDICNASGAIMTQLFKKYGLECPYLDKYVSDREGCLSKVMEELNITRATAKTIFIEIFFGGSGKISAMNELVPTEDFELPKICRKLSKEYKKNIEALLELEDFQPIKKFVEKKNKDKDPHTGQYASLIYHEEERKVLEAIYSYIVEKAKDIEHPTGALIFDGLHVRKEFSVKKHLNTIQANILIKTGYEIKLEVKDFGITDEDREKYLAEEQLSYEAKKELFEKNRFKVDSKFVRFDETEDEEENLIFYDKTSFTNANEDWIEDGKLFLKHWYEDTKKRRYDRIELACVKPENRRPNVFYAFPKFNYARLTSSSTLEQKAANIAYFCDYVLLLVEDNKAYLPWMLNWLADSFQNPDSKGSTPIAVVLYGRQGCGKSWLVEKVMKALLGRQFVHRTSTPMANGDVLHDFNKSLRHKIFIEFAEINLKTHAQLADRIKELITTDYHNITLKGKDSIQTRATDRDIFTTNNAYSLMIEKDDRRYSAFQVSDRRKGDSAYWNEFFDKLKDTNFISDISEFLLTRDISKVCLRDSRPITAYYQRLKTNSLPVELDFMKDLFIYSDPVDFSDSIVDGKMSISSAELFQIYNNWREKQKLDRNITQKMFYSNMLGKCGDYGIDARHTNTGNSFDIDTTFLKKKLFQEYGLQEEVIHIPLSKPVQEEKVEEKVEEKIDIASTVEDIRRRFREAQEKKRKKLEEKEERLKKEKTGPAFIEALVEIREKCYESDDE